MLAVTGISYMLSRYAVAYMRASYMRNQAQFLTEAILENSNDPKTAVSILNGRASDLSQPFEFDIVRNGVSLLTEQDHSNPRDGEHTVRTLPDGSQLITTVRPGPLTRTTVTVTLFALIVASFLTAIMSVFLLYARFRDKADVAKSILTRMRQGDLKARFPSSRWEDFGQLPALFNEMATDIESLVDQLRQKERVRMELLQELAHDLRTPVSSLRNLVETLRFGAALEIKDREELMDLAYQESEYLTRLVEDLLFLALVLEPKYKPESAMVDLRELVGSKIPAVEASHAQVEVNFPDGPRCWVTGNPQQLRRLIRNALENASSFARSRVDVQLEDRGADLRLVIRDDGPGFSPEALQNFGRKRGTRYQTQNSRDRLSVGLGSVIMNAIVSSHGGSLTAENDTATGGQIKGSRLTIILNKPYLSKENSNTVTA
jgi:hypothetical protein